MNSNMPPQTPDEDEKGFELWGFFAPNPLALTIVVTLGGMFTLLLQSLTEINARMFFGMITLMTILSGMGLRLSNHRYAWLHRIIFGLVVISFAWFAHQERQLPPLSPFQAG